MTPRRGKKENKEMSELLMEEAVLDPLDTGLGAPAASIQAVQEVITQEHKTKKLFGKMQEDVRKMVKFKLADIMESIDPANKGKSREIKVRNPNFDITQPRTDSDSNPYGGDNPFWMKDYEELYSPFKYKENTLLSLINLIRGESKELFKEVQSTKKALIQAQKEVKKLQKALENGEDVGKVEEKPQSMMGDQWFS